MVKVVGVAQIVTKTLTAVVMTEVTVELAGTTTLEEEEGAGAGGVVRISELVLLDRRDDDREERGTGRLVGRADVASEVVEGMA